MVTLFFTVRSADRRAEADRTSAQQRANDDRDAAMVRALADREAAHERDRASWRRDTLLRLATEAMSGTVAATEQYRRMLDYESSTDDATGILQRVIAASEVILSASTTLTILGVTESASECRHLYIAVTEKELQKLVRDRGIWHQGDWERFAELLGKIDHRAGVFAQIIAKDVGEPKQKLLARPFRP
ncbi:MAG: hypothetical protein PGN27_04070 [Mycolicibacterium neoaurum]|uniref:hypothetical protein n=1 Tax=Mycolicibacterium neoaurum TaxID=1795 RepID=UPI002FFB7B6C